jgi:hypothetical protein
MRREFLENEATACRKCAEEFAGQAEQPFLLNLATAFEHLARSARRDEARSHRKRIAANQPPFQLTHSRTGARHDTWVSAQVTLLMITLWGALIAFAYLTF